MTTNSPTQPLPQQPDYHHLQELVNGGDISKLSKADLERYAVMLARHPASAHFSPSQYPQLCETVRMLLLVRISEESNTAATRLSIFALVVAVLSLIVSVIAFFSTQRVGILLQGN